MNWSWSPHPPHAIPAAAEMQQHPAYGATCRLWGRDVLWATLGSQDDPVATAQVVLRRLPVAGTIGLVSRGPVWRQAATPDLRRAAVQGLSGSARGEGLTALVVTPAADACDRVGSDSPGTFRIAGPRQIAEIGLDQTEEIRRRAMHGKWRNRLVRAENAGIEIRSEALPPEPRHWLLRAEAAQQRQRRYRGLPPGFAAAWASANPGKARIYTARLEARTIAAMLFLLHPPGATYQIGWSGPEGRAANAHNLLLWRASRDLASDGVARLDLGSVETEAAAGLARFKTGSGAKILRIGATRLLVDLDWAPAPLRRLFGRQATAPAALESGPGRT